MLFRQMPLLPGCKLAAAGDQTEFFTCEQLVVAAQFAINSILASEDESYRSVTYILVQHNKEREGITSIA